MPSQRRLQSYIALLKESATKAKDIQDNNIIAARIIVKIPESGLDPQRHDIKEVKSLDLIMIKDRMSQIMNRGITSALLSNNLIV